MEMIVTQELVLALAKSALWTTLQVAAPMLVFGLIAGVLIGLFQAVTQIHEMTLAFIPKVIMVVLAIIIFLPWMLSTLVTFTERIFGMVAGLTP